MTGYENEQTNDTQVLYTKAINIGTRSTLRRGRTSRGNVMCREQSLKMRAKVNNCKLGHSRVDV